MFNLFFNKKNKKSPPLNLNKRNKKLDDIKSDLIDIKNSVGNIEENIENQSKINWKFILSILPLYFSVLAFLGVLIGSLKSKSYLEDIGYGGAFPEIIGSSSTLIGIVVAYSLLVFLLAVYFALPFYMFLYINYHQNFFKNFCIICTSYVFYILISFLIIVWAVLEYNSHPYSDILFNIGVFACVILPLIVFVCFKKSIEIFLFCLVAACLFFYSYIYPFLYIKIIVSLEVKQDFQWLLFLAFPVANILINGTSLGVFYKQRKQSFSQKNDSVFMGVICVSFLILSVLILSCFTKFSDLSLYAPKFIEKRQDSSWYLIHNGNTTSETVNGMTKDDISQRKNWHFNAKDCENYLGYSYKEKCATDNQVWLNEKDTLNQRPDALYGYMAWNLGNTKVFCPQSVDFFDGTDNKEKSAQCFVIDGKYLQPISEYYLSK